MEAVALIEAMAWPATVLVALALLHAPLAELLRTLGSRVTRLSAFKVEVELATLAPAQPRLETSVEGLRQAFIGESGLAPIAAGVIRSGSADYVRVDVGGDGDEEWLTSRLFLLAAILERSRVVRALVFTGRDSAWIGAAAPRDVRAALGLRWPEYERALFRAQGRVAEGPADAFRGGVLSDEAINHLASEFLQPQPPAPGMMGPGGLTDFAHGLPPPPPPAGWVLLLRHGQGPDTYELADWVTAGGLRGMLGERLMTGAVRRGEGEETTRAVLRQSGAFVAITDANGAFRDLGDRLAVAEAVARRVAAQAPGG